MAGAKPQYKRSWKNLLLNKRYQLRFTLFMVGVSAVLMSGLGIWVMKEANEATSVSKARFAGEELRCPQVPAVVELPEMTNEPSVPMNIDEDTGSAAPEPAPEAKPPANPAGDKPAEPKPAEPKGSGEPTPDWMKP